MQGQKQTARMEMASQKMTQEGALSHLAALERRAQVQLHPVERHALAAMDRQCVSQPERHLPPPRVLRTAPHRELRACAHSQTHLSIPPSRWLVRTV